MALPTCQCIAGKPPFERLDDIFCALASLDNECTTPTLVSATIDGADLTLVFSETVTGHDGFAVEIDGGNVDLTYVSGEGTDTLLFTTVPAAAEGEEVILDYIPGDVANGDCPLEPIDDFPVTNNTASEFNRLTSGGDFRVTSNGDNRIVT